VDKALFITFEGGEGAGKTTLIEKVKKALLKKKLKVLLTREPGGTKLGEQIRDILLNYREEKISPKAELSLFLASRAQHIYQVIKPSLSENKIVLCDRYNDSSIAYQGHARGLGIDEVINYSYYILEDAIPDLTLYLDVDPKVGLSRVKKGLDRIESEKMEFHYKIREGFYILEERFPERIKIIDASKTQEEVFENTMQFILNLLD